MRYYLIGSRGYKTFFVLNAAGHDLFSLLINMKLPKIVRIIIFITEKFSCSAMLSKKEFAIVRNLRFISRTISCSAELSTKKVL